MNSMRHVTFGCFLMTLALSMGGRAAAQPPESFAVQTDDQLVARVKSATLQDSLVGEVLEKYHSEASEEQERAEVILKRAYEESSEMHTRIRALSMLATRPSDEATTLLLQAMDSAPTAGEAMVAIQGLRTQRLTPSKATELADRALQIDTELQTSRLHGPQAGTSLLLSVGHAGGPAAYPILKARLEDENGEVRNVAYREKLPMIYGATNAPEAITDILGKLEGRDITDNYYVVAAISALNATTARQARGLHESGQQALYQQVLSYLAACVANPEAHEQVREVAYHGIAQILAAIPVAMPEYRLVMDEGRDEWMQYGNARITSRMYDSAP